MDFLTNARVDSQILILRKRSIVALPLAKGRGGLNRMNMKQVLSILVCVVIATTAFAVAAPMIGKDEKSGEAVPPNPDSADDITISITAFVAHVDDNHNLLGGAISVGDNITGTYTYDSTTPDSHAAPTVGDYRHYSSPYGITVNAGGFVFETDPSNVDFIIEIVNDHGTPPKDGYVLASYNNLPLSNGATVEEIYWALVDPTLSAVSSDDLPTEPPVLADWDPVLGLTMKGEDPADPGHRYFIRAYVSSAEIVSSENSASAINDDIQGLPADAFKNNPDQRKNAFSNKLDEVNAMIEAGEYHDAINKLRHDIRAKCDGSLEGHPNNDWITDPVAQAELCAMIDELIAYLETLL